MIFQNPRAALNPIGPVGKQIADVLERHANLGASAARAGAVDMLRNFSIRLSGDPRSPIDPDPNACRFYGRCPVGFDRCGTEMPALQRIADRDVACHLAGPQA